MPALLVPMPWAAPLVSECIPCDANLHAFCANLTACLHALQDDVMGT